jgi:hypothetical protein
MCYAEFDLKQKPELREKQTNQQSDQSDMKTKVTFELLGVQLQWSVLDLYRLTFLFGYRARTRIGKGQIQVFQAEFEFVQLLVDESQAKVDFI